MFGFKKRTWIIGGVIVALLGTGAYASRLHNHSPEERVAWVTERISGKLDLKENQRDAFEKVAASYMEIRGTSPEFMLDLSDKLKELANDDTLTVEEVNALREQIKAEFDKRADILIPEFVSFYNTLDSDQRTKVTARLDHMREHMEERATKRKKWYGDD